MSSGKFGASLLVHSVVRRCFEITFPSWGPMRPPNDRNSRCSSDEHRDRFQRKAWRMKSFLENERKRRKLLLLCWLGPAVERLSSYLQHIDSQPSGNGLLDIVYWDERNPFVIAVESLFSLVKQGRQGDLGALLDHFPVAVLREALSEARAIGWNFAGRITWRFFCYRGFPYRFTALVHPSVAEEQMIAVVDGFGRLCKCCLGEFFEAMVKKHFPDCREMLRSPNFKKVLLLWRHAFRYTNMSTERLLALIRRACPKDADIERICAAALLAMLLGEQRWL